MQENGFKYKLHKLLRSRGFLIGMLIVGILILIYPIISNHYYSIVQNNYNTEYEETIEGMSKEEVKKLLESARNFNARLYKEGGSDLFSTSKFDLIESSLKDRSYPEYFLSGHLIGTVVIPKIKVTLPIFVGVGEDVLEKACGFMLPSSLPVGGESTHSILTAHRGLPSSRLFRDLGQLNKGDIFFVKVLGKTLAYEAESKNIIVPTDFSQLGIGEGRDEVTLLTCHPYTINSHRMLVKGHRVAYTEKLKKIAEKQKKDHALKLFYERNKEYIYGILIFAIIATAFTLREKRKNSVNKN